MEPVRYRRRSRSLRRRWSNCRRPNRRRRAPRSPRQRRKWSVRCDHPRRTGSGSEHPPEPSGAVRQSDHHNPGKRIRRSAWQSPDGRGWFDSTPPRGAGQWGCGAKGCGAKSAPARGPGMRWESARGRELEWASPVGEFVRCRSRERRSSRGRWRRLPQGLPSRGSAGRCGSGRGGRLRPAEPGRRPGAR